MRIQKIFLFVVLINPFIVFSQEKPIEFFAFLNMMEGDTVQRTLEYDITYIQSVGFDGIGIELEKDLKKTQEIVNDYDFKSSIVYFKVNMDEANLPTSYKEKFKILKGSKAILTPSFYSASGKYSERTTVGDERVKSLLLDIAKIAKKARLDIAIFPHFEYYVSSHKHAFAIAKEIGKFQIGFSFNLNHWLATENLEGRNGIFTELMDYKDKLKVVTINGANRVITEQENPWDDYLLPLGKGTYDTYNLVEYLLMKQGYSGPIGVQCEGLKGDKMQLAEDVMLVWKSYLSFIKETAKAESN